MLTFENWCDAGILGRMTVTDFNADVSALEFMPFVCGDGKVQRSSPIENARDSTEECDLGYDYTYEYSACADGAFNSGTATMFDQDSVCQCNVKLGFLYDNEAGTCLCNQRPGHASPNPTGFTGSESSALAGGNNTISFAIDFADQVRAGQGPPSDGPMVVEIIGLTGSQTSDTVIQVTCMAPFANPAGQQQACENKLGILKRRSDPGWDWGKAEWDQASGTLRFSVLATISSTLALQITLQNRAQAQTGVRPRLRICGSSSWTTEDSDDRTYAGFDEASYSGTPLLGSSAYVFAAGECGAGAACTLFRADVQGDDVSTSVATVEFVALAAPMTASTPEAIVGRGVTNLMHATLPRPGATVECNAATEADPEPTCSTFAGKLGSMLHFKPGSVDGGAGSVVTLALGVDEYVVRRRGGCYLKEDKTLKLCLPGYVGLYRFNASAKAWAAGHNVTSQTTATALNTAEVTIERESVTGLSTYAALATAPCCDYDGHGAACGDKVCVQHVTNPAAAIMLGGGTLTKMPGVAFTDRPPFTNPEEVAAAANPSSDTPKILELKSPNTWYRMCPGGAMTCLDNEPDPAWPEARFGHSAQTVGFSTVLIYGGMGCKTYETVKIDEADVSRCTALRVLDDLWEINVLKGVIGDPNLLSRLLISPSMPGLAGMTKVTMPYQDNRILVFGGSSFFHAHTLIMQATPTSVAGSFQVRDLEFRAGKGSRVDLSLRELSSHTAVYNASHVILFGGFIGNSLSSATFIYELSGASPPLAFSPVRVLSQQVPPARAFHGLVKPDDDTLVVFGGYSEGSGMADMWKLDILSSSWTVLFKENKNDKSLPYPSPLSSFAFFYVPDLVLCTMGGLHGGYKAGVSFRPTPASPENSEYQVTNEHKYTMWDASGQSFVWEKVLSKGHPSCCSPSDTATQALCELGGYGAPCAWCCEPKGRAMHTLTFGYFVSGAMSLMAFGGCFLQFISRLDLSKLTTCVINQ